MAEIIKLLPVLAIAAAMNLAAGTYYNVDVRSCEFDKTKMIRGVIKAAIVCGMFMGTAYCFDAVDLSVVGITPAAIMNAAIILYISKAVTSLAKILGVSIPKKNGV